MSLFDEIRKNVTDITGNVTRKSSAVIETQRLRMNKASLESDLRDSYIQLGKLYEKQITSEEPIDCSEEVAGLLGKVDSVKKAIADVEDAINKARGVFICPECGKDVQRGFDFCPSCGTKIEKPAEPEEEEIDVTGSIDGFAETVRTKVSEMVGTAQEKIDEVVSGIRERAQKKEAAEEVDDLAEEVCEEAEEIVEEAEDVSEAAEDEVEKIFEAAEEVFEAAEDKVEDIAEAAEDKAEDAVEAVGEKAEDVAEAVEDKIEELVEAADDEA